MKKILFLFFVLTACQLKPEPDQCLRQKLFEVCLKSVPKGPHKTKYNDWAEVIGECRQAAYYNSLRKVEHIKPECRAD